MSDQHVKTIDVTIDKSHIVTIGERLYGEAMELIRELVNNAYDADAEEVRVAIEDDQISVQDDGLGMDLQGLRQYFNIGSTAKRRNPKSPKFGRDRIGEFGIGKFASLAACARFEVHTKKGEFQARVIFDKEQWSNSGDHWQVPLDIEEPDHRRRDGTRVVLKGVAKRFNLVEVEKRIRETVPIKAPNFSVYLNGCKISPKFVAGHKIPFLEGTEYGAVYGEIIITASADQNIAEAGIECKVKQVTVTREFFGLEKWVKNISRIHGEVNADFVPLTSDRTGFIRDTPEYRKFLEVMTAVIDKARPVLADLLDQKENRRARKTLTDVLDKIKTALILNPDYCPAGMIPIGDEVSAMGQPGYVAAKRTGADRLKTDLTADSIAEKSKKKRKSPSVKRLSPTAVVKKMKLGQQGINCCIDHFGNDSPECFTEGAIIYINRDHPLYRKESQKRDTYTLHLARLLTQEICLMKDPRNPRQAFQRQSKLLHDALIEQKGLSHEN